MKDKKTLVIGTGISGISACNLLTAKGKKVILFDSNDKLNGEDIIQKLDKPELAEVILGTLEDDVVADLECAVLSPGVPIDSAMVLMLMEKEVSILGEIELAYLYEQGELIAITGTNGKTTTTALVGKIVSDYYDKAFVVGNIGNPYTKEVVNTNKESVTVAEISSFQLETISTFKPHVSAILNITPDHLNRHHTMDNYIEVKENIAMNQNKDDFIILNYDDEILRKYASVTTATPIFFSSSDEPCEGFFYRDETIYKKADGEIIPLIKADEMKIIGVHNMENAMAAIAMTDAFGIPIENILASVREFVAVEHRIEFVAEKNGVRFYNDSKGTNVDAAIKGIRAMNRKTCLIGGGYDKGSEYDEWIEAFEGKVKKLVLIGATKHKIAECAQKHGFEDVVLADTFKEAFDICVNNACPGDAVLLSPACASWGMFENYEQRGNIFKEYVNRL